MSGDSKLPGERSFLDGLEKRHRRGRLWKIFFATSIIIALLALAALFLNVINETFGSIAIQYEIDPLELTGGRPLDEVTDEELVAIIHQQLGRRFLVILRDELSVVDPSEFTTRPVEDVFEGQAYPEGTGELLINELSDDDVQFILLNNVSRPKLEALLLSQVAKEDIVQSWPLDWALFRFEMSEETRQQIDDIQAQIAQLSSQIDDLDRHVEDYDQQKDLLEAQLDDLERALIELKNSSVQARHYVDFPDAELIRYHSWLDSVFLITPMSSFPEYAGIRTAILGTVYIIVLVLFISLPIGVGAAIYLEEYANDNWFNRVMETNIRNLAGVPSIIYGILGLAILVRVFAPITSGALFGFNVPQQTEARITYNIGRAIGYDVLPDVGYRALILGFEREQLSTLEVDNVLTALSENELARFTANMDAGQYAAFAAAFLNIALPEPDENILAVPVENQRLADADFRRLVEAFFSFRQPSLIDFGLPSQDRFEQAVNESVTVTQLTPEQYNALVNELRQYSRLTLNGRTILAAALTLALLILPIIIINTQEAIRAVPASYREASYGLGATQWQTIWRTILPTAIPGILTGTILAISRAIGETAPLIVVGASTFIAVDPDGLFAKFTALPIQIWQWSTRPQAEFRNIAAAAIIVLLVLMLLLNATAIILRNRFSKRH